MWEVLVGAIRPSSSQLRPCRPGHQLEDPGKSHPIVGGGHSVDLLLVLSACTRVWFREHSFRSEALQCGSFVWFTVCLFGWLVSCLFGCLFVCFFVCLFCFLCCGRCLVLSLEKIPSPFLLEPAPLLRPAGDSVGGGRGTTSAWLVLTALTALARGPTTRR